MYRESRFEIGSNDRDYFKGIARILTCFSRLYQLAPTVCRRAHRVALDRHNRLESISSCGQSIPMVREMVRRDWLGRLMVFVLNSKFGVLKDFELQTLNSSNSSKCESI